MSFLNLILFKFTQTYYYKYLEITNAKIISQISKILSEKAGVKRQYFLLHPANSLFYLICQRFAAHLS